MEDYNKEIKIDFLTNEFEVACYKLFSHEPIRWDVLDSEQCDITYHKGENARAITIHIKHKPKNNDRSSYTNLPLQRIQAPNINQIFPLPLLKLEVPNNACKMRYNQKKYHKTLAVNECNVIEIYMTNKDFDIDTFMRKFPGMHLAFLMLSFEVFATNTVTTGRKKSSSIIPSDGPKTIMTELDFLDDVKIIAIHYEDKQLDESQSKLRITFIENELSEAIFSMMKIVYPEPDGDGTYDSVCLGCATLSDVNQPVAPFLRPSIGNCSLLQDGLRRGQLTEEEKEKLYWHALKLRIKLRDALIEYSGLN